MKKMTALLSLTTSLLISAALVNPALAIENAEGAVYCHGKTIVEFKLVNPAQDGTASDVDLTVNGKTSRLMTAYSWYGSNQKAPKGFKFAILGEKQFDPLLVFNDYLLDAKKQQYKKCN